MKYGLIDDKIADKKGNAENVNLVLIGMPTCGKSTVGKNMAQILDMDFADSDTIIEEEYKMSISEIFAKIGEKAFRDMETDVIKKLSLLQNTVIATGGGTVLRNENVNALKRNGILYFIDRPLEYLVGTPDRPLASNAQALKKCYDERYKIYCSCCDVQIVSDNILEHTLKTVKEDFVNRSSRN